jgi:hypothetical protein
MGDVMPTMRHPRVDGSYEAVSEEQASMLRMTGWVTEPEAPELFAAAAERERAATEALEAAKEPQDDKPAGESGENKPKTPRAPRATSDKESN